MHSEILQPLTLLALWSMAMWVWMYLTRIPALLRSPDYDAKTSVGSVGADLRNFLPPRVQWKADNYNHLMEQPTVFYAVGLALALMGAGDGFNAMLAWIYVAFRVVHSLVQALVNRVVVRFALHLIGTLPLLLLTVNAVVAAFDRS
ncbi:MAPEG family protein [Sphingomonas sp. SUN039]|uniref:MAPEG family protein n=1 Tax=Sphingomonas sp. SUN039 TaxID=2937787 RepID=UPI0021644B5D|nr:MAPEG family protein [Sphingomonas sp. SUN039]UVO53873.1 MAPEG family protein [Sphingomonas sp. SUN039]